MTFRKRQHQRNNTPPQIKVSQSNACGKIQWKDDYFVLIQFESIKDNCNVIIFTTHFCCCFPTLKKVEKQQKMFFFVNKWIIDIHVSRVEFVHKPIIQKGKKRPIFHMQTK